MEGALDALYVHRSIADVIARVDGPVVVVEGPHGVGKTAMLRRELVFSGFHYVTLADAETFQRASQGLAAWAAGLPKPVIIDDAHLVEGLLSAVLMVAPRDHVGSPLFIVAASRALGWSADCCSDAVADGDGADAAGAGGALLLEGAAQGPLVPQRFTLFPLTQAEINGRRSCVVDDLFDRDPLPGFHSSYSRSDLRTMMRLGGLPEHALHLTRLSPQERSQQIRAQLHAALEDGGEAKGDIDQEIERSILTKMLSSPGLPLGVERAGLACHVDAPTLIRHLNAFEDRLLIHHLSEIDSRKRRKRSFTRSRVHPIDTAFAVEAFRAMGRDIAVDPTAFGRVLRALCVNQLVPAAQWASEPTVCCHWKRFFCHVRRIDLVLSRGDRMIGIKIRNSNWARGDTLGSMNDFAKDERFFRGFIVYAGSNVIQLADNVWAIPASALWERGAFRRPADEVGSDADADAELEEDETADEQFEDEDDRLER